MTDNFNELEKINLGDIFAASDKIGKKRYHKLTPLDFEKYRQFDYWRYTNGDYECGTTQESKIWVAENSERNCPVCGSYFSKDNGRSIDHKLPRSQYPWLSMSFDNFWVICRKCNVEKGEMHWYEYEKYILRQYPRRYADVKFARPIKLLNEIISRKM